MPGVYHCMRLLPFHKSTNGNLRMMLFLFSNFCTALIVYLGFYLCHHHTYVEDMSSNVGRQVLGADSYSNVQSPPHHQLQVPPPTPLYYLFNKTDAIPLLSSSPNQYLSLCKIDPTKSQQAAKESNQNPVPSSVKASKSLNFTAFKSNLTQIRSNLSLSAETGLDGKYISGLDEKYIPYVIGITPTYYRLTQRLDMTSLCQTLMNVPRFLWIVIEDSNHTSQQVKDILSRCQVESVLLSMATSNESKTAKQKGVDQRNIAMDWIRNRCRDCEGRGTCEGVVYFMDDDNTYDIRLFEKIRWTQGVSVFPVGLVAGLKFEGPICNEGKVEKWQVAYSPSRHIPVDMAAFAVNVKTIVSHPTVKMGFKPGQTKRSTPGYLEPDFLKSLGAKRETVECRGASDEILVWHVKSSYKKLIYEDKHPSNPNVKV